MQYENITTVTVRSTEIDVNAHVNNAKYLEYLEWGREAWYEQFGLDYDTLRALGVITVVVRVTANYRMESKQNDQLRIYTHLCKVGNTSCVMSQKIRNQNEDLVLDAEITIVMVHPETRKPVPVPIEIRGKIEQA